MWSATTNSTALASQIWAFVKATVNSESVEVSAAVVFLMSNGFMNGETLHVDGGTRLV